MASSSPGGVRSLLAALLDAVSDPDVADIRPHIRGAQARSVADSKLPDPVIDDIRVGIG